MNLQDELYLVIDALCDAGIEYALCGGLAVVVHGCPRLTRDIDLLIREQDLDRARDVLEPVGYLLEGGLIPFGTGGVDERKVFRVSKAEGEELLTLDLLLVSPFLEDVWHGRETHEIENRRLSVVSRAGLAKMKRAAGRPQDLADLANLGIDEDDS